VKPLSETQGEHSSPVPGKPLSLTHPTLWNAVSLKTWGIGDIQKYTVDVAEHKQVENTLVYTQKLYKEVSEEVERLKKELEEQKATHLLLEDSDRDIEEGLTEIRKHNEAMMREGERRAKERVKEAIYKVSKEIYWEGTANEGKKQILRTLLDDLGLGEEEQQ